MKKRVRNVLQYKIGEDWASTHFSNKQDHGFIFDARAHDNERGHNANTSVNLTTKQISDLLAEMNELQTAEKNLIIIRTYSKAGEFKILSCYFIVVHQAILESNKKTPLYFQLSGKHGKEYWENKSKGLVEYFEIPDHYLI